MISKRLIAKGPLTDDGLHLHIMQVAFDRNGDAATEILLEEPVPLTEVDARIKALMDAGGFDGIWEGPIP